MPQKTGLVYWSFVVLLVVGLAQVTYWMADQIWFVNAVVERAQAFDEERLATAQRLLDRGLTIDEIEDAIPGLRHGANGFALDTGITEQLVEERRSRINRYLWEGGFFLVVLCGTLAVIASVLRHDARLRRRQENFLATVSHEFKSPLAAAKIATETVAMRELAPEKQRVQLERSLRSLDRLDSLVDNLLDSARIDSGTLTLRPEPLDVAQAIRPLLRTHVSRAELAGTQLISEIPDELQVLADEFALTTVVRNLVDNALRACAAADTGVIRISADVQERNIRVQVSDNGAGFEPALAKTLFSKFYRPGDEMRRAGQGVGLGLNIVERLMQLSNGTVIAYSDGPGHGATFTTTWPRPTGS
ncbi:MAG: GHKL domain-containing protein [Acidobacteria bacterium]|nr:GHKL domain-containing protein [Acidobacteriota bacterium]